jgi:hypothetical protein
LKIVRFRLRQMERLLYYLQCGVLKTLSSAYNVWGDAQQELCKGGETFY